MVGGGEGVMLLALGFFPDHHLGGFELIKLLALDVTLGVTPMSDLDGSILNFSRQSE